jgi:hypothetical protein
VTNTDSKAQQNTTHETREWVEEYCAPYHNWHQLSQKKILEIGTWNILKWKFGVDFEGIS